MECGEAEFAGIDVGLNDSRDTPLGRRRRRGSENEDGGISLDYVIDLSGVSNGPRRDHQSTG